MTQFTKQLQRSPNSRSLAKKGLSSQKRDNLTLLTSPAGSKLTGSKHMGATNQTGHKPLPQAASLSPSRLPHRYGLYVRCPSDQRCPDRSCHSRDIPAAAAQYRFLKMRSEAVLPMGSFPGCSHQSRKRKPVLGGGGREQGKLYHPGCTLSFPKIFFLPLQSAG